MKDELDNSRGIKKYPYAENSWMGIGFNTQLPLLDSKEFRIILDEVINDRNIIINGMINLIVGIMYSFL